MYCTVLYRFKNRRIISSKWADFNAKQGTLRITKTLYNPTNNFKKYHLLTPKTTGSKRTIEIDETLIKILKKHEIKQREIKLKNKPIYQDNGFIFARDDGHPQLRKVIETRLHRLLKKAEIKKNITPHSFRHTYASLMFEAGATIKEVLEQLGHTDPKTTTVIIYSRYPKHERKDLPTV
ncbi:tyrosine-type recombinase/integrase [Bacillus sp. 7884-1]|uniref:tyrosine-type recombinase/integrase n=1 Tax=Bacillus sp. 7884-1 TaxID=2021693 RepID=UPI000BA79BA2|nr:hypothetical protein CHI06_23080 [Bacillus sp. 7884-1]